MSNAKDLIEAALLVVELNPLSALPLLKQAVAELEPKCEKCGSECGKCDNAGKPDPDGGRAVVYGKDGYSDTADPRRSNATKHEMINDKVTAVHTTVHTKPETRFKCTNVFLIDEVAAGGQTVAIVVVLDKDGRELPADVRLAYEYTGNADRFDHYLPAGNARNEFVITNKGWPPNLFPLAICILNGAAIDSDVVGNLGLSHGHHHGFKITFQER